MSSAFNFRKESEAIDRCMTSIRQDNEERFQNYVQKIMKDLNQFKDFHDRLDELRELEGDWTSKEEIRSKIMNADHDPFGSVLAFQNYRQQKKMERAIQADLLKKRQLDALRMTTMMMTDKNNKLTLDEQQSSTVLQPTMKPFEPTESIAYAA